ncbi:MAG TPA: ABC transporter ATP-binding protein [Solirubrobacteraceae bacterium]|nr:ABC transporter ATP-binding protein [Solirubrobacteraceae bacterium]
MSAVAGHAGERSPRARPPLDASSVVSRYAPPKATIDPDRGKSWIGRALPVVKAHRLTLGSALILSFVGLVLQVQIPNLLNEAVTNSLQRHTVALSHYVTLVFALAVAAGLSAYAARLFLLRTAYAMEFDLRNIIYEHLTRMSFAFYDRVQSGQLISRANSDIRSVQMYLTFAPAILVQCAVALVAFAYMLSINVPLALVAMSTTPMVYVASVRMRKQIFPVSWLIQQRLADVATIVDENINGVRVVKSFVAEPRELTTLARAAAKLRWAYIRDADIRARFTPTVQNLPQVGLALVLLFGGWLVLHDGLPVGAILAFSAYIVMLQAPFQLLGMLIMLGQRAKASAGRIYEILDEAPTITDRADAIRLDHSDGDVQFDDVTFAYAGGPEILEHFTLHLRPGETVAMVGRTASGKSTVSRLLPRFYDVTGGALRLDGHDVRDLSIASLRSQIGVVLDEPFLFTASIRDNIAYGRPDANPDEVRAAARAANAAHFIEALPDGYDTVVGERGYTLSGGQRQRVAIARTLLLNPPILVLDDATSAVDVQVEQEIHEALRVLMEGRTTLIVAHRLSTIGLADRVVLLDGGRIVADGTHTELLETTPLYVEVLAQAEEAEREARAAEAARAAESEGR